MPKFCYPLFSAVLFFIFLAPVKAADYQTCLLGQNCTVGEFLFDDDYQPLATASCTLTSRDPGGAPYINTPLSGTADGWYAHSFTTTTETEGLYRGQICCTVESDYLCIDKSFKLSPPPSSLTAQDVENAVWDAALASHSAGGSFGGHVQGLQTPDSQTFADAVWNATAGAYPTPGTFGNIFSNLSTLTAADVWNYTNRTMTGFGTLIADMWNYSTRSLSSFGDIIAGIWEADNRTLTTSSASVDSATKADIATLKNEIAKIQAAGGMDYSDKALLKQIAVQVIENRDLLDAIINQPIITSSVEDGEAPDLQGKIDTTKLTADELYAVSQQLQSRTGLIVLKWDKLTRLEIDGELTSLRHLMGDPQATGQTDTVATKLAWLNDAWPGTLSDTLTQTAQTIRQELQTSQTALNLNGTTAKTHLQTAVNALAAFDQTIGDVTNTPSDPTLFGKLKEVQELAKTLDNNDQALKLLISTWNQTSPTTRQTDLSAITQRVLAINRLGNAQAVINDPAVKPENRETNQLLGLQAVNSINRSLLAAMRGQPVKGTWLENGSVVFRTLVTNPSERISQRVPLKYYLPKEVKLEDIIKADSTLKIDYDAEKGALYAQADIELGPGESQTFSIEVTDIWVISPQDIQTLKQQAEELMKPLQKTAFFGQGATLKSDIEVTVNKILSALEDNRTPEARIRFYRETQIELAGTVDKLDKLKELVAQAGNTHSLFGFIGSSQALAVWGIVLTLVAAVAFLAIYIRILRPQLIAAGKAEVTTATPVYSFPLNPHRLAHATHADSPRPHRRYNPQSVRATRAFMILVVVLSSAIFTLTMLNIRSVRQKSARSSPTPPTSSAAGTAHTAVLGSTIDQPLSTVRLTVPAGRPLPLRTAPTATATIITNLEKSIPATLLDIVDNYAQITFTLAGTPLTGWVDADAVSRR